MHYLVRLRAAVRAKTGVDATRRVHWVAISAPAKYLTRVFVLVAPSSAIPLARRPRTFPPLLASPRLAPHARIAKGWEVRNARPFNGDRRQYERCVLLCAKPGLCLPGPPGRPARCVAPHRHAERKWACVRLQVRAEEPVKTRAGPISSRALFSKPSRLAGKHRRGMLMCLALPNLALRYQQDQAHKGGCGLGDLDGGGLASSFPSPPGICAAMAERAPTLGSAGGKRQVEPCLMATCATVGY